VAAGYVCPECGLDYDTVSRADSAVAVRSFPRRFREALAEVDDPALLRRRPAPDVWSALEYTAHVRDVFAWMASTVDRMVLETDPQIDFPDQDEVAQRERYNEQDVEAVLTGLSATASRFAESIDRVGIPDLDHTARFSWGQRDVLTMIRNGVHEGKHHLRDLEHVLARVV
jgi:hypothetical protein